MTLPFPEIPGDPLWLWLLPLAALTGGFIDAIAGGGALLTLPALLLAGLDPVAAIATNKIQAWLSPATASMRYHRQGLLIWRPLWPMVVGAMCGAGSGAWLIQHLDSGILIRLVPMLLLAVAAWLAFNRDFGLSERPPRLSTVRFAWIVAPLIGFWDGLIGPGTGAFFALTLSGLAGFRLLEATARAKVLNLATNLTAIGLFAFSGKVNWGVGVMMAVGMAAGGWLGAHVAIKGGVRLIRVLLISVSTLMSLRLMVQWW